jgi:hypothetical protein
LRDEDTLLSFLHIFCVFTSDAPPNIAKIANNDVTTHGVDNRCTQGQWQFFLRFSYPDHLDAIYLDEDSVLSSDSQVLVVSF